MKILMLNHHVTWRGAFTRAFQFAHRFVQQGHEVDLVTISPNSRFRGRTYTIDGVRIVESPDLLWGKLRSGWDPWDSISRTLTLALGGVSYDVIHAFDSRPVVILPALFLRWKRGGYLISDWGDWWGRGGTIKERDHQLLNRLFEPVETFFEEKFRPSCDGLVTVSNLLRHRAHGLGVPGDRIRVIGNGCDVEGIAPLPKEECRVRLGFPTDSWIVAFSAFTTYELDFLLKAFEVICTYRSNSILLVTGSRFTSVRGIPNFPNAGKVVEVGMVPRDELGVYLSSSDVCLLPFKDSITNGARSPGKVWDYISAGRPVVSNDVGEVGDLIRNHKVGTLASYDPVDFGVKTAELLADTHRLEVTGQLAREVAENKFSWKIKAEELLDFYRQVCSTF